MHKIICLIFCLIITSSYCQNKKGDKLLDSIFVLRALTKNDTLNVNKRVEYGKQAIDLSKIYGLDSTLLKSKKGLSSIYLYYDISTPLKKINFEILELASKIKDSSAIGNANYILGFVYNNYESKSDSAYYYYYNALKVYENANNNQNSGEILFNMAVIQKGERDYIGSEINAIKAKKLIEHLPETENNLQTLWLINNLLGLVSRELEQYDKSKVYNETAFKYTKNLTDGYYYRISTISNIASSYRKKGDYNKAITKFEEILANKDLISYDSASYASAISNLANTKFLNGIKSKEEIELPFREAIEISRAINDVEIELYTYFYIGKYFEDKKEIDSAKKYANKSYKLSKATNTNIILLQNLILKASLSKDSSQYYLMQHIKLNDSLVLAERSIRNKFARIDYETDVIKQEKEAVSRQNLWLIITSTGLLFSILLLYTIKTQREKNKELQFSKQQQETNEEIYNLMLSQQDKMEEARATEKKRISQEIHDGILGRLFGTRLSLDSLNMVNTEEAIASRENYINELKEIEKDIRKVSHDLNTDFISKGSYIEMLTTLIVRQCAAYGIDYKLDFNKFIKWENLSNKTKIHLYRIVQESLQNIYKHANANLIIVTLKQQNNLISLTIKDNGIGFDKSKKKDGIGIKNIKSRVKEINGAFNIISAKNEGTTLLIEVSI